MNTAEVNHDDEVASEESEELGIREIQSQEAGMTEPSTEAQLKGLEEVAKAKQEAMARLSENIESTKSALKDKREKLGLPPTEEDPPSISSGNDELERLQEEQEALKKQKEELVKQQEKERLIREEKERIMQERINAMFEEFEKLDPSDFASILNGGETSAGNNVESKSMGHLDPEMARSFATAFNEGIKLLPKILETFPDLLKKLDEDALEEATRRVEKKLEEEKAKLEEEQKEKAEPEIPKQEEKPIVPEIEPLPTEGESEIYRAEDEWVKMEDASAKASGL